MICAVPTDGSGNRRRAVELKISQRAGGSKYFYKECKKSRKIEYMSAVCSSGCRCCEPYLGIGILSPSAEKLRTNLSRRKHSMDFLHQGTTRRGLPKLKCLKCPVESQGLSRIEQ